MPYGDGAEVPQILAGQRVQLTRKDLLLFCVITALAVAYPILLGKYFLLMWLAFPVARLLLALRPPTVVAATGIRRPWRAPSIVYWSEVEGIPVPVAGDGWPTLALCGGKTVALQDLPVTAAAAVAAIGSKPMLSRTPLPTLRAAPHRPTDEDLAADVQRRADALSKEWKRMEADNSHRPRPTEGTD